MGASDGQGLSAETAFRLFKQLTDAGLSARMAARIVGLSRSTIYDPDGRYQRWLRGESTEPRHSPGRPPIAVDLPPWFIPAARFFWLQSNCDRDGGSTNVAVLRALSLPTLPRGWSVAQIEAFCRAIGCEEIPAAPESLRELVYSRLRRGLKPLPERILRQIRSSRAAVQWLRAPREAALAVSAPGGATASSRHVALRAGDVWEADDGTVNFAAWIEWPRELAFDAATERWGCWVGRWQLLLMVDVATHYISGWALIARPRGSYRVEDILRLYHVSFAAHGLPRRLRHERGIWDVPRVRRALELAGIESVPVYSPHQKPIVEGSFSRLWTQLSVATSGQLGRYRGEMERENAALERVRSGTLDPRREFPSLTQALAAVEESIDLLNRTPTSGQLGRWVPVERWSEQISERPLRALAPELGHIFLPIQKTWTVRSASVGGRIEILPGLTCPVSFGAPYLLSYEGARVTAWFDPWGAAHPVATLTLAARVGDERPGKVIGQAPMTHSVTEYVRGLCGLGKGISDAGRQFRREVLQAMRREVRSVIPGRAHVGESEVRRPDQITRRQTDLPQTDFSPTRNLAASAASRASEPDWEAEFAELARFARTESLDGHDQD